MSGRVLLIANNFPPVRGGSAAVYHSIAREFPARFVVLTAWMSYAEGMPLIGWREHDRQAPYKVHRSRLLRTILQPPGPIPSSRRARLLASDILIRARALFTIVKIVSAGGYCAICLGELFASGWMIRPLRWLLGVPIIVYVHGEEITTRTSYDPRFRRCRRALRAADGIVAVSRFSGEAVAKMLAGVRPNKIKVISNGVATERFTPGRKRPDLVEKYDLGRSLVFVSVCRLLEKKGIDNALRAFAEITRDAEPRSKTALECRFLVVGTGPYHETLAALAGRLGLDDTVIFAGAVTEEDLVDHYRLGDIFVMPNRELPDGDTEGFGLVFLEANGCGLPVIAGRDGGSTDAVADGVTGLVVDGNSVPEIAAAMRRLRDDRELRDRLGSAGRVRAAEAGWMERTEAFLRFCTECRRPPRSLLGSRNRIAPARNYVPDFRK